MADMDLDELDGPSAVPSRTTRFAPKGFKFKPQPKLKLKSEPDSSDQKPQESDSVPPKKEEADLDSQPPLVDSVPAKIELECSRPSAATDEDVVKMDVEAKLEHKEEAMVDTVEEDDGGDRVVREIDVFFTPRIDSNSQAIRRYTYMHTFMYLCIYSSFLSALSLLVMSSSIFAWLTLTQAIRRYMHICVYVFP